MARETGHETHDLRRAPDAPEILRTISNQVVLTALIEAARVSLTGWLLAALGRLPPDLLRESLHGDPLLDQIAPILLLSDADNWLAGETILTQGVPFKAEHLVETD